MFLAWKEFRKGKRRKKDVALFELHLEDNLFCLHEELVNENYNPDPYEAFSISDPKPRKIHKASVRDRVLNQAIFRILYPIFNERFIFDSLSSRKGKGTHAGVARLFSAARKITANWRVGVYALKGDVAKFFDSVDHKILFSLIKIRIDDKETLKLIKIILDSFEKSPGRGLPLGNVTSQLFANIYLNELDRFAKHTLKVKYYFRYADDFVILQNDKTMLEGYEKEIRKFLTEKLLLRLHNQKVLIRKASQGIDFLGYVVLRHYIVLRTKTKRRIFKKIRNLKEKLKQGLIDKKYFNQVVQSYLGLLSHCKGHKIKQEIFRIIP